MIVEDHRIVAEGLERLIDENSDNRIVAVCSNLKEASAKLAELKPQVVLLDVAFPDFDGIDAIPELQQQSPETRFIMLTMFADASVIQRAMQAGAQGYLFKSVGTDELLRAIGVVVAGGTYLCEEARQILAQTVETKPMLTLREREILRLISEGLTMKAVADKLCLSFETVHSYTKVIRQKLGCNNSTSMVRTAIEQHLI